jgi:hypothetical protein
MVLMNAFAFGIRNSNSRYIKKHLRNALLAKVNRINTIDLKINWMITAFLISSFSMRNYARLDEWIHPFGQV